MGLRSNCNSGPWYKMGAKGKVSLGPGHPAVTEYKSGLDQAGGPKPDEKDPRKNKN